MAHDPIYRTCAQRTIYGDGEAVSGCLAEAGGVVAGEALAPLGASLTCKMEAEPHSYYSL